jgi:hypothetical protein
VLSTLKRWWAGLGGRNFGGSNFCVTWCDLVHITTCFAPTDFCRCGSAERCKSTSDNVRTGPILRPSTHIVAGSRCKYGQQEWDDLGCRRQSCLLGGGPMPLGALRYLRPIPVVCQAAMCPNTVTDCSVRKLDGRRSGTDPCTRAPTLQCGSLRRGPKGHWNESLCGPNAIAHRLRAKFAPPNRTAIGVDVTVHRRMPGPRRRRPRRARHCTLAKSAPGLLTVSHSAGAGRAALRAAYVALGYMPPVTIRTGRTAHCSYSPPSDRSSVAGAVQFPAAARTHAPPSQVDWWRV